MILSDISDSYHLSKLNKISELVQNRAPNWLFTLPQLAAGSLTRKGVSAMTTTFPTLFT